MTFIDILFCKRANIWIINYIYNTKFKCGTRHCNKKNANFRAQEQIYLSLCKKKV